MKLLHRLLDSPLALAIVGIALGLLVHHLTSASTARRPPGSADSEVTDDDVKRAGGPSPSAPRPSAEDGELAASELTPATFQSPEDDAGPAAPPEDASGRSSPPGREAADPRPPTSTTGIASPAAPSVAGKAPLGFREIWAYLYRGEENRWTREAPITDLCLFNFSLDDSGHLRGDVSRPFLKEVRRSGLRSHLVVSASGGTLFHFLLVPGYGARARLISDLVELASRYPVDGFQLDFEGVRPREREHLVSFLRELRSHLPRNRTFSLALPAKTERARSAYYYHELRDLADRFFIMVYDFHWRGGPPGGISPREWHDRVVAHALHELPAERVVIGLPFYGRIWQTTRVARAIRYEHVEDYLRRPGTRVEYDVDHTHRFLFTREVEAEGWFDDASSLYSKLAASKEAGVRAVGFWRLGQEDERVWTLLRKD